MVSTASFATISPSMNIQSSRRAEFLAGGIS
jgi:hypothetical protein